MFARFNTGLLALIFCLALLYGARPVAAANINFLQAVYIGQGHNNTNPATETVGAEIDVTATQPNGNFTGNFGPIPLHGKVTGKGVVTFNGTLTGADSARIKGKGQLSATGKFIVGTFTIDRAGGTLASLFGKYTFHLAASP